MTGLVYLAIIALWVMFLIPWLSRHRDEHHGRRTADRYHRAMDTLARAAGQRRSSGQHDDVSEHDHDAAGHRGADADDDEDEVEHAPSSMPGIREVYRTLSGILRSAGPLGSGPTAKRRRRVIGLLVIALAGSVAAAVAGVVPGAAPAAVGGLLVVYLTIVVRQVARSSSTPLAGEGSAGQHREAAARAQRQARGLLAPPRRQREEPTTWEAVPTTLPTYVSKPKASKVPRVVDLTSPGRQWTGAAMVQRAQQERQTNLRRAQEQFDREMAVLEPDPIAEVAELANAAEPPAHQQRPVYRRAANG